MVQQKERTEKKDLSAECRHHWVIEPASGPVSKGRCRLCGLEKEFRNYLEQAPWGEEVSSPLASPEPQVFVSLPEEGEMD